MSERREDGERRWRETVEEFLGAGWGRLHREGVAKRRKEKRGEQRSMRLQNRLRRGGGAGISTQRTTREED